MENLFIFGKLWYDRSKFAIYSEILENKELEPWIHEYVSKKMLKCIESGDMLQETLQYIDMQE